MAYEILTNEIGLILPTFPMDKRPKRGGILVSVLGGIASSVIGLTYVKVQIGWCCWYMILHQFLDNSDSPSIVEQ